MKTSIFDGCKALLLDFGGTLDSDGEHWLDRFIRLYKQNGLDIAPEDIKRVFYHADERCCRNSKVNTMHLRQLMEYHVTLQFNALGLKKDNGVHQMVAAFCIETEQYLQRNVRLLRDVNRRYRLGLISNFYGNVETLCREAGLAEFFDVILDSTRVGIGKPQPEIFLMALRRFDLPPEQVIFVGDSYERDMIPARDIGLKTIWLEGPNPRIPPNAGPVDARILRLTELEALIL